MMQPTYMKATVSAAWVSAVAAIAFFGDFTPSVLVLLAVLAILGPLVLMWFWRPPVQTTSQSIQDVLRWVPLCAAAHLETSARATGRFTRFRPETRSFCYRELRDSGHLFDGSEEQGSAGCGLDQAGAGLQQRMRLDRQRGRRSLDKRTRSARTRRVIRRARCSTSVAVYAVISVVTAQRAATSSCSTACGDSRELATAADLRCQPSDSTSMRRVFGAWAVDRPRPVAFETAPVRRHSDGCCSRVDDFAVTEGAAGRSRAAFSGGWVEYRHSLLCGAYWTGRVRRVSEQEGCQHSVRGDLFWSPRLRRTSGIASKWRSWSQASRTRSAIRNSRTQQVTPCAARSLRLLTAVRRFHVRAWEWCPSWVPLCFSEGVHGTWAVSGKCRKRITLVSATFRSPLCSTPSTWPRSASE